MAANPDIKIEIKHSRLCKLILNVAMTVAQLAVHYMFKIRVENGKWERVHWHIDWNLKEGSFLCSQRKPRRKQSDEAGE